MKAFDALMERYRAKLFSFIYRMVRNRSDAEDLFQETFFRVVRELPVYQERGKFKSFLFQVAHNVTLDYLKRSEHRFRDDSADSVQLELSLAPIDGSSGFLTGQEDVVYREQMRKQLQRALNELPENQREVVLLRYYSDLSFNEIAEIVGSPLNTVLGRMHYALKKLKGLIGEQS